MTKYKYSRKEKVKIIKDVICELGNEYYRNWEIKMDLKRVCDDLLATKPVKEKECFYCGSNEHNAKDHYPTPTQAVCEHCKGTGRIYDGNTHTWSGMTDCHKCKGTGFLNPTPSKRVEPIERLHPCRDGIVFDGSDALVVIDKVNELISHIIALEERE